MLWSWCAKEFHSQTGFVTDDAPYWLRLCLQSWFERPPLSSRATHPSFPPCTDLSCDLPTEAIVFDGALLRSRLLQCCMWLRKEIGTAHDIFSIVQLFRRQSEVPQRTQCLKWANEVSQSAVVVIHILRFWCFVSKSIMCAVCLHIASFVIQLTPDVR